MGGPSTRRSRPCSRACASGGSPDRAPPPGPDLPRPRQPGPARTPRPSRRSPPPSAPGGRGSTSGTAYLDHGLPAVRGRRRPGSVRGATSRAIVLVPLLLGNAYHGRVDAPAALRAAVARHPPRPDRVRPRPRRRTRPARCVGTPPRRGRADAAGDRADRRRPRVRGHVRSRGPRGALERLARTWRPPGRPAGRPRRTPSGPGPRVGEAVARPARRRRPRRRGGVLVPGARACSTTAPGHRRAGRRGRTPSPLRWAPRRRSPDLVLHRYDQSAARAGRRRGRLTALRGGGGADPGRPR